MNRAYLPDGDAYKPVAVYYEEPDSLDMFGEMSLQSIVELTIC